MTARAALDVAAVRRDFPILATRVHGRPLVYLDNAATTQKPRAVLEALRSFHEEYNANIHRAVHALSARATTAYEAARETLRRFINAAESREVVFVRGATEGINLVAQTWGRANVRAGDEVLVTHLEHHSNIVPWQMLCDEKKAALKAVPVTDAGELDLDAFDRLLTSRTKLVALAHVSNALGTVNPVKDLVSRAHAKGAMVLVDGAQAAPHAAVDVRDLDADFYVFSGHKVYGPTGIGVLYGKAALLEAMPPWQGGGDMIETVSFACTTYNALPHKFEAGTPNIAGAIGLGAAAEYLAGLGVEAVREHEHALLHRATEALSAVPGVRLIGTAREKAAVLSFVVQGAHPHDLGTLLDQQGVAIRTGHHCAMPLMERLGVTATARASFGLYNTLEEADAFAAAVAKARELLA